MSTIKLMVGKHTVIETFDEREYYNYKVICAFVFSLQLHMSNITSWMPMLALMEEYQIEEKYDGGWTILNKLIHDTTNK